MVHVMTCEKWLQALKSIQACVKPTLPKKKHQSQIGTSGNGESECNFCLVYVVMQYLQYPRFLATHIDVKKDDKYERMSGEERGRCHSTVKGRNWGLLRQFASYWDVTLARPPIWQFCILA